jgi:hypothetical protein
MSDEEQHEAAQNKNPSPQYSQSDTTCPVCGATLIAEKCKVVCRSEKCLYRIVFNCSEF